jgi:hypothetical protein
MSGVAVFAKVSNGQTIRSQEDFPRNVAPISVWGSPKLFEYRLARRSKRARHGTGGHRAISPELPCYLLEEPTLVFDNDQWIFTAEFTDRTESVILPGMKGVQYLAKTLSQRNQPIRFDAMVGREGDPVFGDTWTFQKSVSGKDIAIAVNEKKRLEEEIKVAEKEGNEREYLAKCKAKLEALKKWLCENTRQSDGKVLSRGFRDRTPQKKCWNAVRTAILRALDLIEKECPRGRRYLRKYFEAEGLSFTHNPPAQFPMPIENFMRTDKKRSAPKNAR